MKKHEMIQVDPNCLMCKERKGVIKRLLKAFRKERIVLCSVISIQMIIIIAFLTYGKEGIKYIFDALIKLIPGV